MSDNPWIIDATEEDFQAAVLDRSHQIPVVVDFWAPWCGPCRALGPLLEQLAQEGGGSFLLAKVNTDDHPNLAGEFGVSGIPAVFAIRKGQIVDQFVGMLPVPQLRAFIQRLTPSEADRLVEQAASLEVTDPATAEATYRSVLATNPNLEAARLGLVRVLLHQHGRDNEAAEFLRGIDSGEFAPEADRLRRILSLRQTSHAEADLTTAQARVTADPESAEARLRLGEVLAARGEYPQALEELLAAAERDKKLATGPVRELMVQIFHIVGVRSPLADDFRSRLQSLLY